MNEKFTSNNVENNEFTFNNENIDYENLIIRLKEISKTIFLLEKKYI